MDELSMQELSDEDLAKLVELGQIPEQQAALLKQQKQAQMLQQRQSPQMYGNDRVQVAASPLEAIGGLMQQYAGQRKEKDVMSKMDALQKQQLQGRQLYANKMMDTPYRRATQPFMQQQRVDPNNVPMPAMSF